jgi:CRP-like cAMP-binding protein
MYYYFYNFFISQGNLSSFNWEGKPMHNKVTLLASSPLFQRMERVHIEALARVVNLKRFVAGAPIIVEGESILPGTNAAEHDGLYILVIGRVEISIEQTLSQPTLIQLLYSGDIFGEGALITGLPRNATAVAATNVTVLMLPASEYRYMRATNKDLTLALHDILFLGMAQHQQRANQLSSLGIISPIWLRTVKLLTLVARTERSEGSTRYVVDHLNRSQLATLLHVHHSTVSDILGELVGRGLITRERSKFSRIFIPNMSRLFAVLEEAGCRDDDGGHGQVRAVGSS